MQYSAVIRNIAAKLIHTDIFGCYWPARERAAHQTLLSKSKLHVLSEVRARLRVDFDNFGACPALSVSGQQGQVGALGSRFDPTAGRLVLGGLLTGKGFAKWQTRLSLCPTAEWPPTKPHQHDTDTDALTHSPPPDSGQTCPHTHTMHLLHNTHALRSLAAHFAPARDALTHSKCAQTRQNAQRVGRERCG